MLSAGPRTAAGAEDSRNKSTPQNYVLLLNTQLCATLSFSRGAVSLLASPKDKCCSTMRLTQPPSQSGEEHQGWWNFHLSKDAWQLVAWAVLVCSPLVAQAVMLTPHTARKQHELSRKQLRGTEAASWKCPPSFGDAGCSIH